MRVQLPECEMTFCMANFFINTKYFEILKTYGEYPLSVCPFKQEHYYSGGVNSWNSLEMPSDHKIFINRARISRKYWKINFFNFPMLSWYRKSIWLTETIKKSNFCFSS